MHKEVLLQRGHEALNRTATAWWGALENFPLGSWHCSAQQDPLSIPGSVLLPLLLPTSHLSRGVTQFSPVGQDKPQSHSAHRQQHCEDRSALSYLFVFVGRHGR